MTQFDDLKEQILAESERLGPDDRFAFACHPGVSCFNVCCGDVNIFLTPYDLLRLKRRLGLSSTELLARHTIKPFTKEQELPVVVLKMDESRDGKPCPFVGEQGCSIYEDRPWPCRMYPVGVASGRTRDNPDGVEFYFLLKEEPCEGFREGKAWTIREWIDDQGAADYDEWGQLFKEINLHPALRSRSLNPQQMEMYFTACYDLDRFRSFVFESSFLDKYDVEPEVVEAIRADDEELLRFAFRWLKACLFGEPTLKITSETLEQYRRRLAEQGHRTV